MMSLNELGSQMAARSLDALGVLVELMGDQQQPGPVRVAAAKGVIDYALKLAEREHDAGLEKLDAALEDMRNLVMVEDQGCPWCFSFSDFLTVSGNLVVNLVVSLFCNPGYAKVCQIFRPRFPAAKLAVHCISSYNPLLAEFAAVFTWFQSTVNHCSA